MSLTLLNSTQYTQSYPNSLIYDNQGCGEKRLGNSRLTRDSQGVIRLLEKTPAEVAGQLILRPIIDKISRLISYISAFDKYLPFPTLPQAEAYVRTQYHFPPKSELLNCIEKHPSIASSMNQKLIEKSKLIIVERLENQKTPVFSLYVIEAVSDVFKQLKEEYKRNPEDTIKRVIKCLEPSIRDSDFNDIEGFRSVLKSALLHTQKIQNIKEFLDFRNWFTQFYQPNQDISDINKKIQFFFINLFKFYENKMDIEGLFESPDRIGAYLEHYLLCEKDKEPESYWTTIEKVSIAVRDCSIRSEDEIWYNPNPLM